VHERPLLSDDELILKAQRGDIEAFEQLVYRHDRRVMSIALTHTKNEDDAKDILQEVFVRAYRALPKFSFKSEFSTWMYRIVTNVCLTYHSRRTKHPQVSLDELRENDGLKQNPQTHATTNDPSHNSNNFDISMQIQKSMSSLSPQQKMVLTLKHFHGYKIREIAVLMNCAEGTVKKHLFTAIARMRRQLKELA
jgi:RNA polymerase sigma-70 factor (ECF subfamily)